MAASTVAGGQGTRLGFDGPKGALPVTPIGRQTLFELFADSIKAALHRFACSIPWYVMTTQANHQATVQYFEKHEYFGLPEEDVALFEQGMCCRRLTWVVDCCLTARTVWLLRPTATGGR